MNLKELSAHVDGLKNGRSATLKAAIQNVVSNYSGARMIETGCYRGTDPYSSSTFILGHLANILKTQLISIDINIEHIASAEALMKKEGLSESVICGCGDSVLSLGRIFGPIEFLYLDSLDFEKDRPIVCQRHQLAELGAALGKFNPGATLLLDDYQLLERGKCGLSVDFLAERGFKPTLIDYQVLYCF